MRPERILISAFGAYAGEQEIDFSALGGHRLFLIHGPTGAGKTTLLDAICFALFGESSGSERGAADLRSHHAAPSAQTFIEFDFALGAEGYRIRRAPAQTLAGRGGRPVKRAPEVTLWRRGADGTFAVLAEQVTPVKDRLQDLLGYTAAEFRQVVMLPQGRFRELLVAERDARADILATLFRTALYRRIEEQLQAMELAARDEAAAAQTHRAALLGEAGAESIDAASALADALAREAEAKRLAAVDAACARAEREAQLAAGRTTAEKLRLAQEAEARLAAVEADAARMEAEQQRLDAARRAQALAGEEASVAAAVAQAARAAADLADAERSALAAEGRLRAAHAALADAPVRAEAAEAAAAEATGLDGLAKQAAALGLSEQAVAEAAGALAVAEEGAKAAALRHGEASRKAAAAAQARDATRALSERLGDREAALALAETRLKDSAALAAARRTVGQLGSELMQATARLAASREILAAARAARNAADHATWATAAAQLAATLAAGTPCPVCGSTHHPSPAVPVGDDAPDAKAARAEEERAAEAERNAHAAVTRCEAELRAAEVARDALAERLGVQETGVLDQAAAAARAAFVEAQEAQRSLPALTARAEASAMEAAEALACLTRAQDTLRMAQERLARATGARSALSEQLPPEARDGAALAARARAAEARAKALRESLAQDRTEATASEAALAAARERAAQALGRDEEAQGKAKAAQAHFTDACIRAGFSGPDACRASTLPPDEIDALAGRIRAFGERRAAARDGLDRARTAAAGLAMPDLAALEAAAAEATEAAQAASATEGMARGEAEAAAARLGRLREADDAFTRARERLDRIAGVTTVARGDNRQRMSLEHFVLASLLDEALSAANDHLGRMLAGRFRLARREEPGRKNARIGLDIEVFDEWTGQARPAGTLSGGEGFCAALALALGLSETVQAHAGARRIDALLIDEGFGSLDEDALDKAMDVLATLPGSERIVGIISHVGELKERIAARLEVSPGARGSTARFVLG